MNRDGAGLELRRSRVDDVAAIVSWIPDRAAMVQWSGPTQYSWPMTPEQLAATLGPSPAEQWNRISWTLLDSGHPVGYASARISPEGDTGRYGRVLVDPARRGSGLGRLLVQRTIAAVWDETEITRLTLAVYDFNNLARRLYQELGFRATGEQRVDHATGQAWTALEMSAHRKGYLP